MNYFLKNIFTLLVCLYSITVFAQPNTNVNLYKDKPQRYKERKLGSEKTGEKKFTILRRLTQNAYTKYNYHFNANNKLNEVINRAKLAFKDDYTKILPFYNYTLDATATAKDDLDSVIYKCTAGILLHDLRNDWIDNLYILLGRAYLYRKDFDSAAGCFQYVNYVYAPKDDGYDIPLGSNASNTGGVFTISTKEKRSLWKKITSRPPSRNESFIWQIRSFLEQDMLGEASGLIGILRSDPYFPKRLQTDLHELIAFWYYKQNNYDSAAVHLQAALGNAQNNVERSRWEFLTAQMYQNALHANDSMAIDMYEKAIKHTMDPLMEIYARLNMVSIASEKKENALQENLNQLIKLAKKDRYADYRDIIYYAAAMLELKRDGLEAAQNYLLKSVKYSVNNQEQKALSFVTLGNLNYARKHFIQSHSFYDSAKLENIKTLSQEDLALINKRKPALKIIAENMLVIQKEDSLQRIALMPEEERKAYVKKILKQLRKEKGMKGSGDEEGSYNTAPSTNTNTDIFSTDTKGDWYFLNSSLKSKGFSDFKTKWGKRPNVDNWRRQAEVDKSATPKSRNPLKGDSDETAFDGFSDTVDDVGKPKPGTKKRDISKDADDKEKKEKEEASDDDLTFEGLMSKLPLDEERLATSNKKIQTALFINGQTFQDNLEEYIDAINNYNELLNRFQDYSNKQKALFNLYYCYHKLGMTIQADSVLRVMKNTFPDGEFTKTLEEKGAITPKDEKAIAATKVYEGVYNLFIEGKFEEAKAAKAKADAEYGVNYWTPQLLFIEAIYYVKQREDSIATVKLKDLIKLYPKTPLAEKAATMIDVLKRRKQIEDYLTKLEIEREEEPVTRAVDLEDNTTTVVEPKKEKKKEVETKKAPEVKDKEVGTTTKVEVKKNAYTFIPTEQQYVIIVFNKVDNIFIKEAKNAFERFNKQKFYNKKIDVQQYQLDEENSILLFGIFENAGKAIDYYKVLKPQAASSLISWIPETKYKYSIISYPNFTTLKETKNIAEYINFIQQVLPDQF